MKKYLSIIIAISLVLSLAACRKMPDSNSSAEITFYGKNMILPETKNLLIPLSGNYAYCIFEAGKDFNYNSFTVPEKANGLEQFFEIIYDETNNS